MPLIPFEPFRQLDAFRNEMNRWMNQNFPSWAQQTFSFGPRIDVSETPTEVVVEAEIPGLTQKDDLRIDVHANQVMLSGEIRRQSHHSPQGLAGKRQEELTHTAGITPPPQQRETPSTHHHQEGTATPSRGERFEPKLGADDQRQSTRHEGLSETEANYYHSERYIGQFHRVISLPTEVDESKASASYNNGILEIRMPKIEAPKGKRIDVDFH
ncbi:Hsp20/alpha crystallin family protein [Numidum massiliense]|uniref:Hsp20/alpha crystallin family protein n=1 Tax=Numidum massiliense TaxID=1522315 RepID=UPI0006D59F37|nr:Hsp20/alpha crystallin family protein [Numidum massiliense]